MAGGGVTTSASKNVAAAVLATLRVPSATETQTPAQSCRRQQPANLRALDATLRRHHRRLPHSRLPSTRCRAHGPQQTILTAIPTTTTSVATIAAAAMPSRPAPHCATTRTGRRARTRSLRSAVRRVRCDQEVCRKVALATGATLSTAPSKHSAASAARLAATASRSSQDRQERP